MARPPRPSLARAPGAAHAHLMTRTQRDRVLSIVQTDATFEQMPVRGENVWVGKCLFCGARLVVALDGKPLGSATVEHIVPRSQGGTDDVQNLALACARCNHEKGVRHDRRRRPSERAREVVAALATKRQVRWRSHTG